MYAAVQFLSNLRLNFNRSGSHHNEVMLHQREAV